MVAKFKELEQWVSVYAENGKSDCHFWIVVVVTSLRCFSITNTIPIPLARERGVRILVVRKVNSSGTVFLS
jgi:hypothetical protein